MYLHSHQTRSKQIGGFFPPQKPGLLNPIHGGRGHMLDVIHIPQDATGEIGDTAQGLGE